MDRGDLQLILNSKVSLFVIETFDEKRAMALIQDLFKTRAMPVWRWSVTEGIKTLWFGVDLKDATSYSAPSKILEYIKHSRTPGAFILCDFHPYLDDDKNIRLLKDIVLDYDSLGHKLILLSHQLTLPQELSRYSAKVRLSMPTDEEIMAMIRDEARSWSQYNGNNRIKTDNITLKKLVSNLQGLPHQDVRRLAHGAIADDGAITEGDLPSVTKAKFELMDMEGVLHFEYSTAHLRDVAGLKVLKTWLQDRKFAFAKEESSAEHVAENNQANSASPSLTPKLDTPKGVLLLGVQGGGKSLAAKAIAGVWGLPLLRLDMAGLFNKYIGETEKNLREALKLADIMAPCVLWIDEIEKGMSQEGSDNATSKRLLGTLLTWMSERKSAVFIVATSNDISQLPPELMRKGRFDEIFFVDLPDSETRAAIFAIHIRKRDMQPEDFKLDILAEFSEGFTGAEIEQAVVSATYAAAAQSCAVTQEHITTALVQTQPLSVVMAEKMQSLRTWASERAVFAN